MPEPLRRANALAAWRLAQRELGPDPEAVTGAIGEVLDADDRLGRRQGFVVTAEKVGWSMLDALLELAVYGSLSHQQFSHRSAADCRWCRQAEIMWHAALVNPLIAGRHTSATELYERVRQSVAEQQNATAGTSEEANGGPWPPLEGFDGRR